MAALASDIMADGARSGRESLEESIRSLKDDDDILSFVDDVIAQMRTERIDKNHWADKVAATFRGER